MDTLIQLYNMLPSNMTIQLCNRLSSNIQTPERMKSPAKFPGRSTAHVKVVGSWNLMERRRRDFVELSGEPEDLIMVYFYRDMGSPR